MKRKLLAASAAALMVTATAACSQPYGGMGPGMMGGYGPGGNPNNEQSRGYGPGNGYGPGYGMGPGMMGGYGHGYGMGPGMMGGYGPGAGMGPGMMGGYGPGAGMGPGMMGGYGMGPGMMMGGYGYIPDLTAEQRAKIGEIQKEFSQQHWALMGAMHSEGGPMSQAFASGEVDAKAAREAYESMAAAHKQMFESALQMRTRIDAVLTKEQREQARRNWRGAWGR